MNITAGSNKEAKEVVKEKLKEENKRIATGSPVELVNATLGWANCKQGDFGIVISRNPTNGYSVYVPRAQYVWNCVEGDIWLIDVKGTDYSSLWNKFNRGVKEEEIHKTMASLYKFSRISQRTRDTAKKEIYQKIEEEQRYITSLHEALNWFAYSTPIPIPDAPSTLSSYLLSANMLCYLLDERYKEIRVLDDGAIRAVTQPISLKYRDEVINLGKYAIRISANEINFERIDPEVNPSLTQGYLHPHIDRNGKACWGNWWNNEINAFLKSRNYWTLLDKLHNFLTSYNESGWFHPVMFWHSDATKLCKTCWEEVCICQERICVHCKKVIDKSCKCVRCPESNEIVGKDYDEYCRISCEIWDKEKEICKSAQ